MSARGRRSRSHHDVAICPFNRSSRCNFGEPVLFVFGLTETQRNGNASSRLRTGLYISRFFQSLKPPARILIKGIPDTHVSLDAEIETIL